MFKHLNENVYIPIKSNHIIENKITWSYIFSNMIKIGTYQGGYKNIITSEDPENWINVD